MRRATMEHERRRWRFRISTLMLLVVIAAPTAALVVERTNRLAAERRAEAEIVRAEEAALKAVEARMMAE